MSGAQGVYPLPDPNEVVLVQVPTVVLQPDGVPMKTVFVPYDSDLKVSTLRGTVGPEEAYRRWTEDLGYESAGTWGVAVAEVTDKGLTVIDDSCIPENPAEHASIDYSAFADASASKRQQIGRKLRDHASERGRLHPAP